MKQELFNELCKSIIFASCCEICADSETFENNIEVIKALAEEYPEAFEDVNLEGVYLFGSEDYSEDPETYKELVEIFGKKLKIKNA